MGHSHNTHVKTLPEVRQACCSELEICRAPLALIRGLQPGHSKPRHMECSNASIPSQTAKLGVLNELAVDDAEGHTLVPDLAVMKLSADVLDACPKLLALTKLSRRPGGSKTGSSLSPAALCATLRALVKDPASHPHRLYEQLSKQAAADSSWIHPQAQQEARKRCCGR